MISINEMELQMLRHLIVSCETFSRKMASYAEYAQTPEFKQFFLKSADSAAETKNKLLSFLK